MQSNNTGGDLPTGLPQLGALKQEQKALWASLIFLCFASFRLADTAFLQIEGKTLSPSKKVLICFTAALCNQTCTVSEVSLCTDTNHSLKKKKKKTTYDKGKTFKRGPFKLFTLTHAYHARLQIL